MQLTIAGDAAAYKRSRFARFFLHYQLISYLFLLKFLSHLYHKMSNKRNGTTKKRPQLFDELSSGDFVDSSADEVEVMTNNNSKVKFYFT